MFEQQKKKELFHIAGDTPDQVKAMDPHARGPIHTESTMMLTRTAVGHPKVYYKAKDGREFVLTADVYKFPGEPFKVALFCPLCSVEVPTPDGPKFDIHTLEIKGDRKHVEYSPTSIVTMSLPDEAGVTKMTDMGGRLDVEKFGCTWEVHTGMPVSRGDAGVIMKGVNLCQWRVVIERNVARDA